MPLTSISFDGDSTTSLFSVIAIALVIALSWIAWRQSGEKKSIAKLECFRALLVVMAIVLLNRPERIVSTWPDQKPTFAILADHSQSMLTHDADEIGKVTRVDSIGPLLETSVWQRPEESVDVLVLKFGDAVPNNGTNLYEVLDKTMRDYANLRGVVLVSDGDWNSGQAPIEAAAKYRAAQIPVHVVPVGSAKRLPDLTITDFVVPSFGTLEKNIRIPFTIESSLPEDRLVRVRMDITTSEDESKQTIMIEREMIVTAMGRTSDAFVWEPQSLGDHTLSLEVPPQDGETIMDNNHRSAPISIREEKLQVLIVESVPRWEYRYLRNALARDPGIEVSCLLFHPTLDKRGGGNRDYIDSFPESLAKLSKYDVVFLGDVGIGEEQLTEDDCGRLRGLVEQQASGLVFLPGASGNLQSLTPSSLGNLLPVVLDESSPHGVGSQTPSHFSLTQSGRVSVLTQLVDDQEANLRAWSELPGFQWHAPVKRAKAGTTVLAVHSESANPYGRIPLIVTQSIGSGKVLFMGTDGAWRWRRGVEDLYHYRFWGQVVRWMAYRRNMAKGESMRFYYSPEQPSVGQTISLGASIMLTDGEPLNETYVRVLVEDEEGKSETVTMTNIDKQWGSFAGNYTPQTTGQHRVVLHVPGDNRELVTSLFVQDPEFERIGKPARPEVLEELAQATGGVILSLDETDALQRVFDSTPEPKPLVRSIPIFSHPVAVLAMVGLLGMFWVARKRAGLL